jgi:hypothetical protein
MATPAPGTRGEARVLAWFLALFFAAALLWIAFTAWRKVSECETKCRARGQARGELVFEGGGRLNIGPQCVCHGATPGK